MIVFLDGLQKGGLGYSGLLSAKAAFMFVYYLHNDKTKEFKKLERFMKGARNSKPPKN